MDEVSARAKPRMVPSQLAYPVGSICQIAGMSAFDGPGGNTVSAFSAPTKRTRFPDRRFQSNPGHRQSGSAALALLHNYGPVANRRFEVAGHSWSASTP